MADSSNSSATGLQTTESQTTSTTNSTGNFSGGLGSSTVSPPSLSLGNDAGPGYSKGDLSFSANLGWVPNISANDSSSKGSTNVFSGATYNAKTGETTIDGNSNTSYSNNKSEPVMSVDEVYGKIGNQSIVESQGDYAASSNEKSNVETSTLGKQDNIAVTPKSVTENKGLVDNATIDSIEGLDFQQKDKESQDVMEAKKLRDDAEAEDKANQMRDSLKAKTDLTVDEDAEFQIGQEAASKEKEEMGKAESIYIKAEKNQANALREYRRLQQELAAAHKSRDAVAEAALKTINDFEASQQEVNAIIDKAMAEKTTKFDVSYLKDPYDVYDEKILRELGATLGKYSEAYVQAMKKNNALVEEYNQIDAKMKEAEEASDAVYNQTCAARDAFTKAKDERDRASIAFNQAKKAYNDSFAVAKEAPAVTPESEAVTPSGTDQALDDAIQNAVENGADEKTVQAMKDIATSIGQSRSDMQKAIAENNVPAYIEAQKQLNENYKAALEIGGTDFNKGFVTAVAKANDFEVTLPDGTKTSYSQFATDMATKSPEIAKAMYEAKAQELEAENHPVLAKIERAKAAMVETWFGSKLTMADNQVRNQFNQMAKTGMRATYAAYNNVLNDPNATPEQKAEASAAISQANGLMTASAALQASTGFLSGIGDSTKDGVYGTTDPEALNANQKTLNTISNFAKIALGLGVTPGANKAYQNMYYMAGAKVNESGLFSKDFDSDGLALCQEYGNNAAAGMIAGAGELATGVALFFNPATSGMALNLVADSVQTFMNGLYGVQNEAETAQKYTQEVLNYFKEAESIAAETGNEEALGVISNSITQIENFELKAGEVENLDNWLEGSGSNTAANEKFNQSLTYDEWLKLIEADPTMKEYAKKLIAEKKES